MDGQVKRRYHSPRRRAVADATRRHIVDSARPLFIEQGYEATSMRQLADAAGVALQTLYNSFGSKFGLFSAVMDVIIVGDHEPVPVAQRAEMQAVASIDDPNALVAAIVEWSTPVLGRLAAIYPTLRAAAASDPQVAEAHQRFTLDGRYQDCRPFGQRLHDLGALHPHLDAERATDVIWTVTSPDVYDLLVAQRRWTVESYRAWATATLVASLLVPRRRSR